MAMLDDEDALIICNGYKDEEYIETALLASKLGRTVIIVVEKFSELPLIAEIAKTIGVRPRIGIRVKLAAARLGPLGGLGRRSLEVRPRRRARWSRRSSFLRAERPARAASSCCTSTSAARSRPSARSRTRCARRAASSSSCSRWARRSSTSTSGGGLGVDYDGSQTNFASSMNYTMQEYANDIVFALQELCDADGVAAPDASCTESGRAVVAHHAMLVVDILGVGEFDVGKAPDKLPREDARRVVQQPVRDLPRGLAARTCSRRTTTRSSTRKRRCTLFTLGNLSLAERVVAEDIFWGICQKILQASCARCDEVPEELEGLERALADTYFCNFSMFQSLPDIWAIDQLFPIMPIHRLNEEPTRRAVLADITCDSDGKIDHFIDRRDVKHVLELHPLDRRGLLPRHLPRRRLPGDPRRLAQPVRQHQHRARVARRAAATRSSTWSPATP